MKHKRLKANERSGFFYACAVVSSSRHGERFDSLASTTAHTAARLKNVSRARCLMRLSEGETKTESKPPNIYN